MSTETKKVNLELAIAPSNVDASKTKYQGLIYRAKECDSLRICPSGCITTYIFLLYKVVIWYMELNAPTMEQSVLVSIVVGAGAAWFGLYTGTSKSKK